MERIMTNQKMCELTEDELLMVSGGEFWKNVAIGGGGLLGGVIGGGIGGVVGGVIVDSAWDWLFK